MPRRWARRWLGVAAVAGAGACSLIVDTSGVDEGCPSGEKFCAGRCVPVNDPTYGCQPAGCEPCRTDNGVPRCGADQRCEFDACLYGFGCLDCSAKILIDEDNCGACGHPCADKETCASGSCEGAGGAGGEGGEGGALAALHSAP